MSAAASVDNFISIPCPFNRKTAARFLARSKYASDLEFAASLHPHHLHGFVALRSSDQSGREQNAPVSA